LANPRDIDDDGFKQLANSLDDIIGKC
jgi:hypothetical protein